ncbi:hypothetical protein [Myxococcus qinghaiensis]|uniref:hypothetical protein n=1 Tax=Myxococcus qinghaiensis TaxID=2906758 RepID=UPI0020A6E15D|nr:hypothetical protein [Myxococcus qinghaiensis]MCP3163245.1 hypothetical protein [Myxococcus qinghaiensis]
MSGDEHIRPVVESTDAATVSAGPVPPGPSSGIVGAVGDVLFVAGIAYRILATLAASPEGLVRVDGVWNAARNHVEETGRSFSLKLVLFLALLLGSVFLALWLKAS